MNYKKKTVNNKKIAEQALEEAKERERERERGGEMTSKLPKEIGGPKELEPTRYGDWEKKGITSDF
jgi:hypothetical protein